MTPRPARRRPDPRRSLAFNLLREVHRSGVNVVNDPDVEWFTWSPRTETIALQPAFDVTFRRGTATLALAHRALGHWGISMRQDMEARELTARWLINDELAARAAAALPTIGAVDLARRIGVTPHVLQVRLQLTSCRCLTNLDIFHGQPCSCGAIPSVAPSIAAG